MRFYPLIILLLSLVITSIWLQGVILLLLIVLTLWNRRNRFISKKQWIGFISIVGFILLGTLPLLITRIDASNQQILIPLTTAWGITIGSLDHFLLILLRVLNGYLCLLLFITIFPLYQLLITLRSSRIPKIITELLEMIYRFIFILIEKANQILTAQKSRMGYQRYRQRIPHGGMLFSRTLILAAQDSDILYDSMLARGLDEFEEELPLPSPMQFKPEYDSEFYIEIKDLTFSYEGNKERVILDRLNLKIRKGEKITLMGANGCGKSTLMKILSGLVRPQAGSLVYSGVSWGFSKKEMKYLRQKVGILFQNADLQLFSPTVWEEIAFGLRNLGLSGDDLNAKVNHTLREFELQNVANDPPHLLSGGQKRWVTLAAVEAMSPEIILLDEPTTGLDGYYIERLYQLLDRWHDEGKTLMISTHDSRFARDWSDRILLLKDKIVQIDAKPDDFFTHTDLLSQAHIELPMSHLTDGAIGNGKNHLPIFLSSSKIRAIIIGGGKGAYRKALTLVQMNVPFDVLSQEIDKELESLCQKHNSGRCFLKTYTYGDIKNYNLAILATGDIDSELKMIKECERFRIHYNCLSEPFLSTFQFGASSTTKGIEIGIHTQYKVPGLGQKLRDRTLENVIRLLNEEDINRLADARQAMLHAKKTGSLQYEELKEIYERLLDEI